MSEGSVWDFVHEPFPEQAVFEYKCREWSTYQLFKAGIEHGFTAPYMSARYIYAAATLRGHDEAKWLVHEWQKYGKIPLHYMEELKEWTLHVKDQIPYGIFWYTVTNQIETPDPTLWLEAASQSGRIGCWYRHKYGTHPFTVAYDMAETLEYPELYYDYRHNSARLRRGMQLGNASCAVAIAGFHNVNDIEAIMMTYVYGFRRFSLMRNLSIDIEKGLLYPRHIRWIERLVPHVYPGHIFVFEVSRYEIHLYNAVVLWKDIRSRLIREYQHSILLLWYRVLRPQYNIPRDIARMIARADINWTPIILHVNAGNFIHVLTANRTLQ